MNENLLVVIILAVLLSACWIGICVSVAQIWYRRGKRDKSTELQQDGLTYHDGWTKGFDEGVQFERQNGVASIFGKRD